MTFLPDEGDIAVRVWQTTEKKPFREVFTTPFTHHPYGDKAPLDVDAAVEDQPFLGVGASMTDASAWLLSRMLPERRRAFMDAAFSTNPAVGAGISALRLNIGSSDYSTALYTYDDVPGDTEMEHFSVARDDNWLFPMTKEAVAANPEMFLFAAPWSPPGWMKDGGILCGGRFLDGCERALVNYLVAYVKAYRERGLDIGAVNVQNEPFWANGIYPTCGYTVEQLSRATIALAQRLREEGLPTEAWYWDHNYGDAEAIGLSLADDALRAAIGGVAWHSYDPSPVKMGRIHRRFPDIPFYHTEQGPALISTERTERWWCDRVFDAFNNGCRLFTAWNLCLDDDGKPLTGPHTCAGLLTVDPDTGEPVASDTVTAKAVPKRIVAQKETSVLGWIGIMFSAFLVAGMLIFILSGYERISRAYSDINTLNQEIEEIKLHISELNVSIECAVTIEEAEQAALAAGMTYPSQSQILVPGQAIPSGGFRSSGSVPSDSESTEPPETSGEPDSGAEPGAAG